MTNTLIGRTLRDYTITEQIGEGGYGRVYRATQASVGREVAIKVILPKHLKNAEFVARFEREAQIIARLEHPHIIPLHDYWRDDEGAYIVMRYVKGQTLRAMIDAQGALPLATTARIFEQITAGLAVAHEAGVIHRDLKPANILLDERENVYLTDFGVAKQVDLDLDQTESGTFFGTPGYLAPEQIQGIDVSQNSDIYSVGVLLHEMLTGAHPYMTDGLLIVMKHLQEPMPPLAERRPDLPPGVDLVLQRATAKFADDRYATVTELNHAFHAAADLTPDYSHAPTIRPKPPTYMPATTADKNRRAMLQNVHTFWIEGLLENSLHGATLLDLDITPQVNTVDNPWDALLRQPGAPDTPLDAQANIVSVFDKLNGKLLILGDPGSGKTTSLLELARDLLYRAGVDEEHPIPVVLNLSAWSENPKPLAEWLVDELGSKYLVPRKVAQRWVDDDDLLLLLDGLDEVAPAHREDCVSAINAYREAHGFVDVVVCSRTTDYDDLTQQLKLNGAVMIQPLTYDQVDAYLDSFGAEMRSVRAMMASDETLWEMCRSPLMLSILMLAYRGVSPENLPPPEDVGAQRRNIFAVYVERMFERRLDAQHTLLSIPHTRDDITRLLGWLARQMQQHTQSVFLIENIVPGWLSADQRRRYDAAYIAAHVLMQMAVWGLPRMLTAPTGYVSTGILNGVVWMVAGGVWGWIIATDRWKTRLFVLLAALMFGIAVGVDASLVNGWEQMLTATPIGAVLYFGLMSGGLWQMQRMDYSRERVSPVERLHFSRNNARGWMVALSALLGMLATFVNGSAAGIEDPQTLPLVVSLVGGALSGGLTGYLTSSLISNQVGSTTRPNQGIYRSLTNGTRMGLTVAAMFMLVITVSVAPLTSLGYGLVLGVIAAVPFGYNVGLIYGGFPVLQHTILRRVLERDGGIPRHLAQLLDYAAALILLRKVGGGYIFIHRYLLEYFADDAGDTR